MEETASSPTPSLIQFFVLSKKLVMKFLWEGVGEQFARILYRFKIVTTRLGQSHRMENTCVQVDTDKLQEC